MSKPLAIDLYAGLGGWSDGLLAEDWDVLGFDIERHVYGEHRYPAQLVIQDVLTLHGSQFRDAALIVASPPCQEFSYMAMPWSLAKAKAAAIRADQTGAALAELTALFDACFRIQREASEAAGHHIPLVVENVRGAIPWVGRSRWNFGSFHLWGDVPALMPTSRGMKNDGGSWFAVGPRGEMAPQNNARDRLVEGIKGAGASWDSENGRSHQGVGHWTNPAENGTKVPNGGAEGWFGKNASPMRQHWSGSKHRKAASAMIAKIPLPLSRHIAATFRPRMEQSP